MPPQVPRPQSRRGGVLQTQLADRSEGRFTERFLEFAYPLIPRFVSVTQRAAVQSMGSRFVRVLALRATLLATSDAVQTGLELASLLLRLQVGAQTDLIVTSGGNNDGGGTHNSPEPTQTPHPDNGGDGGGGGS